MLLARNHTQAAPVTPAELRYSDGDLETVITLATTLATEEATR